MANRWEQVLQLTDTLIGRKREDIKLEYKDIFQNGIYYRKFSTKIRGMYIVCHGIKLPIKHLGCYPGEKRTQIAFAAESDTFVGPTERGYHLIQVPDGTMPEEAMSCIVLGDYVGRRYLDSEKINTYVISPYTRVQEILKGYYESSRLVKHSPDDVEIEVLKRELNRTRLTINEFHILCDDSIDVKALTAALKETGGIELTSASNSLLTVEIPVMRAERTAPRTWDLRKKSAVEPEMSCADIEEEWYS